MSDKKKKTKKMNNSNIKAKKFQNKKSILIEEKAIKENKKSKNNWVFLIIFVCLILSLLVVFFIIRNNYLNKEKYTFDYFSLRVANYVKDEEKENKLVSEDGKCIVVVTSQLISDVDINEFGRVEKINNKEWAKQEFANGYTWLSYHKNMLYIVQMYAEDNNTFTDLCLDDFVKIKRTFSFIKDE